MTTEPYREQCAQNAIATLQTIRVADDYWYDIRERNVSRHVASFEEISGGDMPHLIVVIGSGEVENLTTYRRDGETFQLIFIGYVQSEDPELVGTRLERLLQDVRKALLANVTLNNVCRTLRIKDIDTDEGSLAYDKHGAFEMVVDVEYVYEWTTP